MATAEQNPSIKEQVFLVVVDDSPEMRIALRYAARRASHVGGRVILLHVVTPTDRQHWMALESLMRQEKLEEADQMMEKIAAETFALTGVRPALHIREGQPREQLLDMIEQDRSISVLVLAASVGDNGPGPLVTTLSGRGIATLRVPVTIVPGSLTPEEVDALS